MLSQNQNRVGLGFTAMVLSLVVASCASPKGTKPDDMSAQEHRKQAAGHASDSNQHNALDTAQWRFDINGVNGYAIEDAHVAMSGAHQSTADAHLAAAEALEQFEEKECAYFPPKTRAACPLVGQISKVETIEGGARATFNEGVNVEAAAAHIQCHLAYAGTKGREGMDKCPLYLKGVKSSVVEAGSVDLQVEDPAMVEELRTLMQEHVGHPVSNETK